MTIPAEAPNDRLVLGPRGVPVVPTTLDHAIDLVVAAAQSRGGTPVHLVNAYSVVCAHELPAVGDALVAGPLSFTDGMPLVWLARRLGVGRQITRVYGPDLFVGVVDRGRSVGLRHYLYGGSPATVQRLAAELRRRYPGVEIVGVESPPYRELSREETAEAQARIARSGAHVVWVGLGTPKQDLVTASWARPVGCTFVAVGAAFDFLAGDKRQAPQWVQQAGLEWLFRLATEPRRLAKRYLVGNVTFLRLARRRAHLVGVTRAGDVGSGSPLTPGAQR
jgi:N-acetylglucosaminyldiphosphoundecaprenol N-acetyl-beta-D-mannosaminyltransferase